MLNNWLHKILNYKATPPEGVWESIASQLDKEEENITAGLTAKMLAYEVAAPATAFKNIFSALDNEESVQTVTAAERMYNYAVAPPVNAWKNIAVQLNSEEAVVIPLQNNRGGLRMIYRIAAAAVISAIILVTAVLVTKKKNTGPGILAIEKEKPNNKQPLTITPEENTATTVLPASGTHKEKTRLPVQQPKPGTAKIHANNPATMEYVKGNEVAALAPNPAANNKEMLKNSNGQTPLDISLMNSPNTYISITGPDGQTVKVSSKFSNLIGYLNDKNPATEENLDIIIKESAKWRATFAGWREKMTNNSVAPSLANFMDIIELSKVLEDKK